MHRHETVKRLWTKAGDFPILGDFLLCTTCFYAGCNMNFHVITNLFASIASQDSGKCRLNCKAKSNCT
jgi:hypothetical protein